MLEILGGLLLIVGYGIAFYRLFRKKELTAKDIMRK